MSFPILLWVAIWASLAIAMEGYERVAGGSSLWLDTPVRVKIQYAVVFHLISVLPWLGIILLWVDSGAHLGPPRRSAIEDFKLSGIGSSQILWGINSARASGIVLAVASSGSLLVILSGIYDFYDPGQGLRFSDIGIAIIETLAIAGAELTPVIVAIALPVSVPNRASRLLILFAVAVLTSPFLITVSLLLFASVTAIQEWQINAAEILSWPVRVGGLILFWKRQCRRIDEGLFG